jgi:hypothetical protein
MRYDTASVRDNGRFRINGFVDDNPTGGTLPASLASNSTTVNVKDSAFFDATVTLTGCSTSGSGKVLRCISSDRLIKATFRRTKDDPLSYKTSIKARRLSTSQTSSAQPVGPVTVVLEQNTGATEQGAINQCKQRGKFALICRRR